MTSFTIDPYFNGYLPKNGTEVDVIVTVAASGTVTSAPAAPRTELILLDVSGSMEGAKLDQAKEAVAEVVAILPTGTRFGLVLGNHDAVLAYPATGELAVVGDGTAAEVAATLGPVMASGGTAFSTWLRCAADQLDEDTFAHAVLLTDGLNTEREQTLVSALEQVAGRFQCDCRGVGADWDPNQLRIVAGALLGTVGHISDSGADPASDGMVEELSGTVSASLDRSVAEVSLRLWTPRDTTIALFKQVSPRLQDLAPLRRPVEGQIDEYPTGAWGDESRDYHLSLRLPVAGGLDELCLAARVQVLVGAEKVAEAPVKVTWTNEFELSATIVPQVAHYRDEEEYASLVQRGIEAHRRGDDEATSRFLGQAVQIAHERGDLGKLDQLARIVDIEDPATGTVNPLAGSGEEWNAVDAYSDETVSFQVAGHRDGDGDGDGDGGR